MGRGKAGPAFPHQDVRQGRRAEDRFREAEEEFEEISWEDFFLHQGKIADGKTSRFNNSSTARAIELPSRSTNSTSATLWWRASLYGKPVTLDVLDRPVEAERPVRTMQAAVITGPRQIAFKDVSLPQPGAGQVRVRLEGCGVCASNITPWEGPEWMKFPTSAGGLGHEGWGIVDAIGPGVSSIAVGDRAATLFENSYAGYDVGDADAVVKLPASLDGRAFPGEPLGCAMNILRRSDIHAGQRVAIIGIGFLGALLTQLARHAGAEVIAISRRESSLELARAMGASAVVPMSDHHEIIKEVTELTGCALCDRVIEATGKQWPLDIAGALVREGGRLVIAGYHQDGPRQVNMQQWNWKGIDVINAHERDRNIYIRGIQDAIEAVEAGILTPDRLYTHRYPLSRLGDALEATRDHRNGFVKALVELR
jgi:threonine dehydrogenase-like Zn-dependent dehydrogenase